LNASATVVLVAYTPPPTQTLTLAPTLVLDDATPLALSGKPVLAWTGWPIIFKQKVLMDYAVLPNGRLPGQVNPNGTLVMGATAFTGTLSEWQPIQTALSNASASFVDQETQYLALQALQASYAQLPAGKIALLPLNTAGAAANFAVFTGLQRSGRQSRNNNLWIQTGSTPPITRSHSTWAVRIMLKRSTPLEMERRRHTLSRRGRHTCGPGLGTLPILLRLRSGRRTWSGGSAVAHLWHAVHRI